MISWSDFGLENSLTFQTSDLLQVQLRNSLEKISNSFMLSWISIRSFKILNQHPWRMCMQKIRLVISQDLSVFSDCCQDQEELTFALCLIYSCEPQGRVISGSERDLPTQQDKIYIHQSWVFVRILVWRGKEHRSGTVIIQAALPTWTTTWMMHCLAELGQTELFFPR